MKLVIAIIILIAGIAGGAGLGMALRPAPAPEDGKHDTPAKDAAEHEETSHDKDQAKNAQASDYIEFARQIVVPVVDGGTTRALVLLELGLAVPPEHREAVFAAEPRLRDAFLRVLFEFSYTGAFLETYTGDRVVSELRRRLLDTAQAQMPGKIEDVLVLDLLRQEF